MIFLCWPLKVDFNVDPDTGYVIAGRGVSITTNPAPLAKWSRVGVPVDMSGIPSGPEIVQANDSGHYEIAARPGANLTADEFQAPLGQVTGVPGDSWGSGNNCPGGCSVELSGHLPGRA